MPITDAYFVRGKISLEEVCELYKNLRYYEGESSSFIHAKRKHGVEDAYNKAIEEIPKLIAKAEKHGLDEFYPLFGNCIKELKESYGLS